MPTTIILLENLSDNTTAYIAPEMLSLATTKMSYVTAQHGPLLRIGMCISRTWLLTFADFLELARGAGRAHAFAQTLFLPPGDFHCLAHEDDSLIVDVKKLHVQCTAPVALGSIITQLPPGWSLPKPTSAPISWSTDTERTSIILCSATRLSLHHRLRQNNYVIAVENLFEVSSAADDALTRNSEYDERARILTHINSLPIEIVAAESTAMPNVFSM